MRDQTRVGKKLFYPLSSLLARDGNLKIGLQPFPVFLSLNKNLSIVISRFLQNSFFCLLQEIVSLKFVANIFFTFSGKLLKWNVFLNFPAENIFLHSSLQPRLLSLHIWQQNMKNCRAYNKLRTIGGGGSFPPPHLTY